MKKRVEEVNVGSNQMGFYFTQIPDEIIEDGLNLDVYDKLVYITLMKYTHKDNLTAFPSYRLLCQMLHITDVRLTKSLKRLQELGLITIKKQQRESGAKSNNLYIFNPIPEKIKNSARLCKSLSNEDKLTEIKVTKIKNTQKQEKGLSKELALKIKELSVKGGKFVTLTDKQIALFNTKTAHFLVSVSKDEVTVESKNKMAYLKGYFSYIKRFNELPNEEVMKRISELSHQFEPKVLFDGLGKAKKENISLFDEKFLKILHDEKNKENPFIPNNKPKKQIQKNNNFSNWEDDDKEFFENLGVE